MLYGAGQGDFYRFDKAISANEIHSSFPGMLFYYGIIPFAILLYWVFRNFSAGRNNPYVLLCYLAYFAETFTLTNQRQPLFWMIIVFASLKSIEAVENGRISIAPSRPLSTNTVAHYKEPMNAHEL